MVNSSIANYNVNNVPAYNTAAFKGTHSNRNYVAAPSFTSQPDTVELSTNKKQGLSDGAKWGIGAGVVAGLGALAYILTRGKTGSKQVQQLAEHIEFKPAKTVEEAKKFAKDKLDVIYFDELGKFEDVEMVNFINEWITKTRNNPKFGKNSYPRIVYNTDLDGALMSMTTENAVINGVDYGYGLGINLSEFKRLEQPALKKHNFDFGFIKKGINEKYYITESKFDNKYTQRLIKNLNSDTLKFEDRMQLILDLLSYQERKVIDGVMQIRERSVHNYLNHEQGHLLHSQVSNNYEQMRKVEEFLKDKLEVSEITKEFINSKDIQATAGKVSNYAKESPLEFVAETFAGLRDGQKYSDDVMALYKKYGGPSIS